MRPRFVKALQVLTHTKGWSDTALTMNEVIKPTRVQALPDYRIYLEFSDGTKGEVDLSDLAGNGVFQVWNDYHFFEGVHLGDHRAIKWDDEIELSADSLYLKLTGKSPE